MDPSQETELRAEIDSLSTRVRVQEFALLEVLQLLSTQHGAMLADGLRARVNAWALQAGPQLTANVDESAAEQVATLLVAMAESTRPVDRLDA